MASTAIVTEGLTKTYAGLWGRRTQALRGVSLSVERGTIFGLLGPNGAGKTTLVKLLLDLIRPTSGTIAVLGGSPRRSGIRRRIGYLPETMRIPEFMRAEGFLRYMGKLNRVESSALSARVPVLLELVGLAGNRKLVRTYSKGMLQRLGIAQALLNEPELLFLDEPTEGLDPIGRKDIRQLLVNLRAGGTTVFLNSHLLSEVEQVCDHVIILREGQVARAGSPSDFREATGEHCIRIAAMSEDTRRRVETQLPAARWDGNVLFVRAANVAELNETIDQLRAAGVLIEGIEQVRLTLEEQFIQVTAGGSA